MPKYTSENADFVEPGERETHLHHDKYSNTVSFYTTEAAEANALEDRIGDGMRHVTEDHTTAESGEVISWRYRVPDRFLRRRSAMAFVTGKKASKVAEELS